MAASSSGSGTVASATGPSMSIPKSAASSSSETTSRCPRRERTGYSGGVDRLRGVLRDGPLQSIAESEESSVDDDLDVTDQATHSSPRPQSSRPAAGRFGSDDPCQEPKERISCRSESRPRAPSQ
jgi:hypothetical protein